MSLWFLCVCGLILYIHIIITVSYQNTKHTITTLNPISNDFKQNIPKLHQSCVQHLNQLQRAALRTYNVCTSRLMMMADDWATSFHVHINIYKPSNNTIKSIPNRIASSKSKTNTITTQQPPTTTMKMIWLFSVCAVSVATLHRLSLNDTHLIRCSLL